MHIDDWLDTQPKDDGEAWAKEFLERCRRPAEDVDYAWIEANALFCAYRGERWRVLGASRLGDVWLTKDFKRVNGYDVRVDVDECSGWGRESEP
jgi:hypothetical protein